MNKNVKFHHFIFIMDSTWRDIIIVLAELDKEVLNKVDSF